MFIRLSKKLYKVGLITGIGIVFIGMICFVNISVSCAESTSESSVGFVNYAKGAVAYDNGGACKGYEADKAIDNNNNTVWMSYEFHGPENPAYFVVSLSQSRIIEKIITLYYTGADSVFTVQIDYSNNETMPPIDAPAETAPVKEGGWVNLVPLKDNLNSEVIETFPPIKGRYFRTKFVGGKSLSGGPKPWPGIIEQQVLGKVESLVIINVNADANSKEISFDLSKGAVVTAKIYNKDGQEIKTLIEGKSMSKGTNSISWDKKDDKGNTIIAGSYTLKILAKDEIDNKITVIMPIPH